ncbi:MAG: alginate export family protein [Pseudomonadota bacterium]
MLLLTSPGAGAEDAPGNALVSAIQEGSAQLDLRYRYETVDSDSFDKRARASLLRSRLTLTTGAVGGVTALFEVDNVAGIGVDDFNSTDNGKSEFPTIADPEGTEFNQAWVALSNGGFNATLGRQRVLLGEMRFIGSKPWRNNEQTYDGLRLRWQAGSALSIDASYVNQINRIFGPEDGTNPADWHGDNLFLNAEYRPTPNHTITAFAYLLDVEAQRTFTAAQTVNNSSSSYGIEYQGALSAVELRAAVATQVDAGASELNYRAPYYLVELGAPWAGFGFRAAYEVLGTDNGVGLATPLANGHRYQGWADQFLATPQDGLEDAWISVDRTLGPVAITARYHSFRAESSSTVFGSEVDLQALWTVNERLTATLKAGLFNAEAADRFTDTTKAWLVLQYRI